MFCRKACLANKAGRVARAHGGKQNEVAVIWFAKVWGGNLTKPFVSIPEMGWGNNRGWWVQGK